MGNRYVKLLQSLISGVRELLRQTQETLSMPPGRNDCCSEGKELYNQVAGTYFRKWSLFTHQPLNRDVCHYIRTQIQTVGMLPKRAVFKNWNWKWLQIIPIHTSWWTQEVAILGKININRGRVEGRGGGKRKRGRGVGKKKLNRRKSIQSDWVTEDKN